ncbi:copper chaperone PCu(A)C [Ramlibacter sp. MAHUQ-53]|uniref:copper chaperone PCu(A)C n=1 Tax=unclassified Ramlibacter TaxID=2617605 RepID=UPI003629C49F
MKPLFLRGLATSLALAAASAFAQVPGLQVDGAWIRTAVPGQSGTGAFMRLTAAESLTLVGVSTPVAGVSEIHEMKMDGDIMRMRPLPSLALPAGQAVELRPGGHHLMLTQLKVPLKAETRVPLTLVLRDARGAERRLELQVPVAVRAPGGAEAPAHHPAGAHPGTHRH